MGSRLTILGGTVFRGPGPESAAGSLVIRNSDYPGSAILVNMTWPNVFTSGSATIFSETRTISSSTGLLSAHIRQGSVWEIEAASTRPGVSAQLSFAFYENVLPDFESIRFSVPGSFQLPRTALNQQPATYTATIDRTVALSSTAFIDEIRTVGNLFPDRIRVQVTSSAFPGLLSTINTFVDTLSGNSANRFWVGTLSGTLNGRLLPAGSTIQYAIIDDTNVPGAPTVTITSFQLRLTTLPPVAYDSGTFAGPFTVQGSIGNPGNPRFQLPPVQQGFEIGPYYAITGSLTNGTSTLLTNRNGRVRVTNDAFPGLSMELRPFISTVPNDATFYLSPSDSSLSAVSNLLRGKAVPAGSRFTVEIYDVIDDPGIDGTLSSFRLMLTSSRALRTPNPPEVMDTFVMRNAFSTLASSFNFSVPSLAPREVRWLRIVVPPGSGAASNGFFHLYSEASGSPLQIALYSSDGLLIRSENASSVWGNVLTFGARVASPWTPNSTTDGLLDGRDGPSLPAGEYYLALINRGPGASWVLDQFQASSDALSASQPTSIRLMSSAPTNWSAIRIPIELANTSENWMVARRLRYSIKQGESVLVPDTEVSFKNARGAIIAFVPASTTGTVTLSLDGGSFLRRKLSFSVNNVYTELPPVVVHTGDVDNNGEVDLTDIDLVIADYLTPGGSIEGDITDLDNSGEVDLTDIDIAVGNYLLSDDS